MPFFWDVFSKQLFCSSARFILSEAMNCVSQNLKLLLNIS